MLGEPEGCTEQGLRGDRSERDQRGRPDGSELSGEPGAARRDVACAGCRVQSPGRRFRGLPAEMLHRVRQVDIGAVDLGRVRARSSTCPAGPTNGSPRRSSTSPGCSPTSIIRDLTNPAPNTTCVADSYRPHPRQARAARRKSDSRIFSGRKRSAPGYVIPAEATYWLASEPELVSPVRPLVSCTCDPQDHEAGRSLTLLAIGPMNPRSRLKHGRSTWKRPASRQCTQSGDDVFAELIEEAHLVGAGPVEHQMVQPGIDVRLYLRERRLRI